MARPQDLSDALPLLRRMARHLGPHVRHQRRLIVLSLGALVAEIVLRVLEPWPLKLVFDDVIVPAVSRPSLGTPTDPEFILVVAVGAVIAIAALRAAAAYYSAVGLALAGNRVLTGVRDELYRHLQRLSLSFHAKASTGDLVVRVIGDVGLLKDVTVTALLPLLGNTLVLVGMLVVMMALHWQLALVALAVVPLFWLSALCFGRRIHQVSRAQRRREGAMAARVAESIGGIRTVKALSLEGFFGEFFNTQSARTLQQGVKAKRLEAALERSVDVLIALATGLVLWYGVSLVRRQALTAGELLVFLTYLRNAFKPVRDFAKYTGRLAKGAAAGERVVDLLERIPDVRNLPGARPAPALTGAVRFERVGFEYEPGQPVLLDIAFTVAPGQRVAIVGPSGAGKSTLVALIPRLYDPGFGRVLVDGLDVRAYTIESLRRQVSIVLQDTMLFAASMHDNIACGAQGVTEADVRAAAVLANAHDFIDALPDRYDTVIGERGVTLSTGQRQRVAIARAAVQQRPITILDEPTAALDEENDGAVAEGLARLTKGRTTFIVTHELRHAISADLILFLERGGICERGSHAELMALEGRYAALYRLQTRESPEPVQGEAYAARR